MKIGHSLVLTTFSINTYGGLEELLHLVEVHLVLPATGTVLVLPMAAVLGMADVEVAQEQVELEEALQIQVLVVDHRIHPVKGLSLNTMIKWTDQVNSAK